MQLARLALVVAAPSRCGGPRGRIARRRCRGPEGLRAAGGAQARNVPGKARPVTDGAAPCPVSATCAALTMSGTQPGPARSARP